MTSPVTVFGRTSASAAALPVTWDGSTIRVTLFENAISSVVGCNAAGGFTLNGLAPVPAVLCGEIATIVLHNIHNDGLGVYQKTGTIDLRGVTKALFGRLTGTEVQGFDFSGTIHGSPFSDNLTAGSNSKIYGYAGRDTLFPSVQINAAKVTTIELWGGDGGDAISGDGAINARLEGGAGWDYLYAVQATGSANGGPDGDVIDRQNGSQALIFGGPGNDVISAYFESPALVDAGSGVDVLKTRGLGTLGGLTAVRVPDPQAKVAITEAGKLIDAEQFETIEIRGSRGQQIAVTMDPITKYVIKNPANLTVKVPGGVWTLNGSQVTAPGLAPVSWNLLPAAVTIVAA
jgi:hypothetical protein